MALNPEDLPYASSDLSTYAQRGQHASLTHTSKAESRQGRESLDTITPFSPPSVHFGLPPCVSKGFIFHFSVPLLDWGTCFFLTRISFLCLCQQPPSATSLYGAVLNRMVQTQLMPNVVSRTVKMNALCCLLICIIN